MTKLYLKLIGFIIAAIAVLFFAVVFVILCIDHWKLLIGGVLLLASLFAFFWLMLDILDDLGFKPKTNYYDDFVGQHEGDMNSNYHC